MLALGLVALPPGASAAEPEGTALNRKGLERALETDERGLTLLKPLRRRSPTGLLYPYPWVPPGYHALSPSLAWRGSLDLMGLLSSGDTDEARFDEYADLSDGVFVNDLVLALRGERGLFMDLHAGALGRDDQYARIDGGVRGLFALRGFFDELPHHYTREAVLIYSGKGSESLELPAPLVAGGNPDAAIAAVVAATKAETRLQVQHKRDGLVIEAWPLPELKLFGRYARRQREGSKAFGGSLFFAFVAPFTGSVVETVVPVDDSTRELSAGLEYAGETLQANLVYTGSHYDNDKDALVWENPFFTNLVGPPVERGRFALAPDNSTHKLRGDLGVALPLDGRLTATLSWGRMQQDDDLLPPTINSNLSGAYDPAGRWNTTDALSRTHADARVDTWLVDTRLRLRPWKPLIFDARFRYYDQQNDTRYTARNPLTGTLGYVAEDGAPAAAFGTDSGQYDPATPGSRIHYRSIPFGYERRNFEIGVRWQALERTVLELDWEREEHAPDHRERERTVEDRTRLALVSRSLGWATARLSWESAQRDGSSYQFNPYEPFYTSSRPDYIEPFPDGSLPQNLAQLRKYDLADREQQVLNARLALMLGERLDAALVWTFRDDDYDTEYGLRGERQNDLSLELGFQASGRLTSYAFAGLRSSERELRTINPTGPLGSDPDAGGIVYPFENTWALDSDRDGFDVGAGLALRASERVTLNADYTFSRTREQLDYRFAGPGAFGVLDDPALAGTGFPELRNEDQLLELSLRARLFEQLAARLYYRMRRSTIDDFHQQGLGPLSDHRLLLVDVDRDFRVSTFGLSLELRY